MGVRGLCNGLGPAAFGLMWHLLGIDIVRPELGASGGNNTEEVFLGGNYSVSREITNSSGGAVISIDGGIASDMPGLPFLIISICVVLALICSTFLENISIDPSDVTTNRAEEADCTDSESQRSNPDAPLAREETAKSDVNRNIKSF